MEAVISWWVAHSWLYNASFSGSLVAMLMARKLSLWGRIQALLVGMLTGCAVGPLIVEMWFSQYDPLRSQVPAAICFFTGLFAMVVIPALMRKAPEWVSKWLPQGPQQ